jgi:hypothetical protein
MLTLSTLAQLEWVMKWDLSGNALPVRTFYYTQQWCEGVSRLSGLKPSHGSGPRRRGSRDPYRAFAAKVETFLSRLTANEIDRTTDVEDLISDPSGNC